MARRTSCPPGRDGIYGGPERGESEAGALVGPGKFPFQGSLKKKREGRKRGGREGRKKEREEEGRGGGALSFPSRG